MNNNVNLKSSKYNVLQKLAFTAFIFGKDNFKEDVIDISNFITYNEFTKHYSITIHLRETEEHTSTSGIGLYVSADKSELMFFSTIEVFTVAITKEMSDLLDKAEIVPF